MCQSVSQRRRADQLTGEALPAGRVGCPPPHSGLVRTPVERGYLGCTLDADSVSPAEVAVPQPKPESNFRRFQTVIVPLHRVLKYQAGVRLPNNAPPEMPCYGTHTEAISDRKLDTTFHPGFLAQLI